MIRITIEDIQNKVYEEYGLNIASYEAEIILERISDKLDDDLICETIDEFQEEQREEAKIKIDEDLL